MTKEQFKTLLNEVGSLKEEIGSLKYGQKKNFGLIQKNHDLIQKNHDLIQKNGVGLEEIKSDVRGVAEGHIVIRREMQETKLELKADIKGANNKVEFIAKQLGDKIDKVDKKLEEHMYQPAHA